MMEDELHNESMRYNNTKWKLNYYIINEYIDINNFKCTYYFGQDNCDFWKSEFYVHVVRYDEINNYAAYHCNDRLMYPKNRKIFLFVDFKECDNLNHMIKKTMMKTYLSLNLDDCFFMNICKKSNYRVEDKYLGFHIPMKDIYIHACQSLNFKILKECSKMYFKIKNVLGVENSIYLGII